VVSLWLFVSADAVVDFSDGSGKSNKSPISDTSSQSLKISWSSPSMLGSGVIWWCTAIVKCRLKMQYNRSFDVGIPGTRRMVPSSAASSRTLGNNQAETEEYEYELVLGVSGLMTLGQRFDIRRGISTTRYFRGKMMKL
jgi:hypothetical protein